MSQPAAHGDHPRDHTTARVGAGPVGVARCGPDRAPSPRLVVLLVALGMLAISCSGGSGSSAGGEPDPGATAPGTVQPADVDPDGTVRVAYDLIATVRGGKFTLDPAATATTLSDDALFYLLYGRMMRRDAGGQLVPDLAESATILDPDTIELKLRPDVRFSDGTPFDAAAVKAGLERTLTSGNTAGFATSFYDLAAVSAPDPLTVRLDVSGGRAANWYDSYLGSWESTIVRPGETDFDAPTGAGPMTLESYTPGVSLALTRSDTYWARDEIRVGGIELVAVTANDQLAGVNALAAGQVDMAPATVQLIPSLGSGNEAYIVENPNRLMTFQVCKEAGPLADPDVRKAISMAVDREAINDALYDGTYSIAEGLWPDGHRLHDPDVDDDVAYDPERAKQLLQQAGYGDGVTIDAYVLQLGGLPELTQIVQQSLAEIGVTLEYHAALNYVDDFLLPQKPGLGVVSNIGSDRQKLDQWTGTGLGNACKYQDPELEQLRQQLSTVSDSSPEAVELWHEIERTAIGADALSIPLLFAATVVGYDPRVVGDPSVIPVSTQLYLPDPRVTYVTTS